MRAGAQSRCLNLVFPPEPRFTRPTLPMKGGEKNRENAMAYEFVKIEREGPVTVFTLNRPEVMNALHSPAHFELAEAFDAFAADPDQWVGIVTGAGDRAFSAGNDLKHQAGGGKMGSPPSGFAGLTGR